MHTKCINPYYNKDLKVYHSCGQCPSCRRAHAREWVIRLRHEKTQFPESHVLNLVFTYDTRNLPLNGSLCYSDFQRFLKRLRKLGVTPYTSNVKISQNGTPRPFYKYFVSGEYGSRRQRPHYHCIFFGLHTQAHDLIEKIWGHGSVYLGYDTSDKALYYAASYAIKKLYTGKRDKQYYLDKALVPPLLRCSQSLGLEWALAHKEQILEDKGIRYHGRLFPVSRYYCDKLGIDRTVITESGRIDANEQLIKEMIDDNVHPVHTYLTKDQLVNHEMAHFMPYSEQIYFGKYLHTSSGYAILTASAIRWITKKAHQRYMDIKTEDAKKPKRHQKLNL